MSSDMYYSYVIKSPEQVHEELIARLESERQEQLNALDVLKRGLMEVRSLLESSCCEEVVRGSKNTNITSSDRVDKLGVFNYEASGEINLREEDIYDSAQIVLRDMDLSKMVDNRSAEEVNEDDKLLYANSILQSIKKAKLDESCHMYINDYVSYSNDLLSNQDIGLADFQRLLYDRYKILIEKIERRSHDNKVDGRIIKEAEKDYVYQNLLEVFNELGMSVKDEIVFDNVDRMVIKDDSIEGVELLMNRDRRGFLFETVQSEDADEAITYNQRMEVVKNANLMCERHKEIYKRMDERGILFKVRSSVEPEIGKVRKREKKNKKIFKRKFKQKYMENES